MQRVLIITSLFPLFPPANPPLRTPHALGRLTRAEAIAHTGKSLTLLNFYATQRHVSVCVLTEQRQ